MIGFRTWLVSEEKNAPYKVELRPVRNAVTPKTLLAKTLDHIPSGSTSDFRSKDTHHNTNFSLGGSIVGQLSDLIRTKVDAVSWDFGMDEVETAIDSVANLIPHYKDYCDQVAEKWKKFKDTLYGLSESDNWWGKRSGSPNPVLYDTALMRLQNLEEFLSQVDDMVQKSGNQELGHLFLNFYHQYSMLVSSGRKLLTTMRDNTPRR